MGLGSAAKLEQEGGHLISLFQSRRPEGISEPLRALRELAIKYRGSPCTTAALSGYM
jgi:hypothetical protein